MKRIFFALTIIFFIGITGCKPSMRADNLIRVGTIAGPETELMETAKQVAKAEYDLNVEIITFNDYIQPNAALAEGSLDANMFQHKPYLDAQIKARGYDLTAVARTFVYPMGIYSKKIKALVDLPPGALVGIPNDPTNEGRALLVLQAAGLITLSPGSGLKATPQNILLNPKALVIKELDAAQLPRTLEDVTIAVINTNYAIPAGLTPTQDALYVESSDSPYANLLVVKTKDIDDQDVKHLIEALQSQAVLDKANTLFPGGGAVPAWLYPH